MQTLLTTLLLLWTAHCSPPQTLNAAPADPADPAPTPSTTPEGAPDAEEQAALQTLERAAAFQRGERDTLPRPDAFHGRFTVEFRDREGSVLTVEIDRTYARRPERMVTTRRDTIVNTDSTVGYDGESVWFRDNKTGQVIVYTDDPVTFETDLADFDSQLQLMPVLLDSAVLDALIPRLQSPRLGERYQLTDMLREKHTVEVVTAEVVDELFGYDPEAPPPAPGAPPPVLLVELGIDAESGALWSFRVETVDWEQPKILELRFDLHLPTRQGLTVPGNIKIYEDGAQGLAWRAKLGVIPEEVEGRDGDFAIFEIDPEVDPALFAIPEEDG